MSIAYESEWVLNILEDVYLKGIAAGKAEGIVEGRALEFDRIAKRLQAAGVDLAILADA